MIMIMIIIMIWTAQGPASSQKFSARTDPARDALGVRTTTVGASTRCGVDWALRTRDHPELARPREFVAVTW